MIRTTLFVALLSLSASALAAPPADPPVTVSGKLVMLPPASIVNVTLPTPTCRSGEFLVQGFHVAPEFGSTVLTVGTLGRWGASAATYQRFTSGAILVPLSVLGDGPVHLSATLAGGQPLVAGLVVTVSLLGTITNATRYEFNAHVTGVCGQALVAP